MKQIKKVIDERLFELYELLKPIGKFYLVGGFVRDFIAFDKVSTDIDIAGDFDIIKVQKLLEKNGYEIFNINHKLGTIKIKKADFEVEFTRLRTESYVGGVHTPKSVKFVNDTKLDALRRDFTVNAIYYDLDADCYLDYFNGLKDIKLKLLKATTDDIFKSDGLRLLRLARFCSKLNFSIDKNTFILAKNYATNLKDITYDRVEKELRLLLCDDNFLIGLNSINELKLWKYLINSKINKVNYTFTKKAEPDFKYVALLLDIMTEMQKRKVDEVYRECTNKKLLKLTKKLYFALNIFKQKDITFEMLAKYYDMLNLIKMFSSKIIKTEIDKKLKFAEFHNLPLTLKKMNINATELVGVCKIEKHEIGTALKYLQNQSLKYQDNSKDFLIKKYKEYVEVIL